MKDKPQVLSKYALIYWMAWAAVLVILRVTLLKGISDNYFPAAFLVSMDEDLIYVKRPARFALAIGVLCFIPIFAGTYYIFFKVL